MHSELGFQINKVLVIGLGQLGLPVAKYVKQRGFETFGYDMNSEKMKQAEKNFGVKSIEQFDDIDVFILCVSTHDPDDEYTPYVDGLFELARKISKDAKNGSLVSIESTVPKGTSKKIFEILNHRLHVAHVPHRWYALEEDVHGVNQVRVIGGVSDCCLKTALQFYDRNNIALEFNDNTNNENTSGSAQTTAVDLGIPLHPVSEIEIAELTKIIENADRYLQIAFSEDLYLYCQANNVNFGELRDSLNTKWNVKILEPRDGVGGHCLPKDTKMFLQSSKSIKSKILMSAMEVDKEYRRFRELRGARLIPHAINSS
ncbi:MAG: NAD(P)-binding domain-containing protein [Nitrososphaeraceae archaeon]|nr:NAD(P)-binding domain-containing protein [Nitrososphaeraceae archaeon]MDW0168493.1 NAD(P)-binding domain-containing protein [Nitrososphaeraceae archaeon]MDW0171634.1 NAD(P)-binding domain-containing protein [Nitrososphaeraceae archaeon]MDW0173371.1 NAD(P)-binding domain-containing protein [Nitrososphaeraceae archaeon]MDW0175169.1 NAD(P)-binding domain-containing protein [Nitrososphaeraceae archaeon]